LIVIFCSFLHAEADGGSDEAASFSSFALFAAASALALARAAASSSPAFFEIASAF
jgi:hypothetical protein